jgi:hypothetical protein
MYVHGPADDRGVSPDFPHHLQPGDTALIARKSASFGAIRRFAMRGVRCAKRGQPSKRSSGCPAETGPVSGGEDTVGF